MREEFHADSLVTTPPAGQPAPRACHRRYRGRAAGMQIDKDQILQLLRSQGDDAKADQADQAAARPRWTPTSTPACSPSSGSTRAELIQKFMGGQGGGIGGALGGLLGG